MSEPHSSTDLALLLKALAFAAHKHRDQRRKDAGATPYINHPISVARVLVEEGGVTDTTTLCAALLHDTLEDTETSVAELEAAFGAPIAGVVAEVSDDRRQDKATRKRSQVEKAPHLTRPARLVELADKICNLRDMVGAPPDGWPMQRRREYFVWAAQVVAGFRGTHAALEAAFDEAYGRMPG